MSDVYTLTEARRLTDSYSVPEPMRFLETVAALEQARRERDEARADYERARADFLKCAETQRAAFSDAAKAEAQNARLLEALEVERKRACHCDFREEEGPCGACARIDAVLAEVTP